MHLQICEHGIPLNDLCPDCYELNTNWSEREQKSVQEENSKNKQKESKGEVLHGPEANWMVGIVGGLKGDIIHKRTPTRLSLK